MVATARGVEWTVVTTEVEALQLEYTWIKEFDPRFNVKYRDDKSYPWLAVTISDEYPRLQVMRGAKRKGVRYFGPYAHAWAIRETLDLLLRVFPARTCSNGVFKRAGQVGRPCLLGYIDKCSAPCVGRVSADAAPRHRRGLLRLPVRLDHPVPAPARAGDADRRAASRSTSGPPGCGTTSGRCGGRSRSRRSCCRTAPTPTSVAFAEDELEAAVAVFHVRGGRVRGQRGYVVDKLEGESAARPGRELPVPGLPGRRLRRPARGAGAGDARRRRGRHRAARRCSAAAGSISGCRSAGTSAACSRRWSATPKQALALHRTKRASDLTARSRALSELQDALDLPEAPLRIECYDVSNLGDHQRRRRAWSSSRTGWPRKSEYRRFSIRGLGPRRGPGAERHREHHRDDPPTVHPLPRRAFGRRRTGRHRRSRGRGSRRSGRSVETGGPTVRRPDRPAKFAYPPNLVVVDGGQPQVEAAAAVFEELGITDIGLCGLAKRLEEVWLPGEPEPVILPRTSEALYLLQRVRDEAHRFAITYHRQKRSKSMIESALDGDPRPRRDPPPDAAAHLRLAEAAAGAPPRRRSPRCPASARAPRRPSSPRWRPRATSGGADPPWTPPTGEILSDAPESPSGGSITEVAMRRIIKTGRQRTPPSPGDRGSDDRRRPGSVPLADRAATSADHGRREPAPCSRSRSSPDCPAPAGARRRSAWRTSAGSSSTTCRPACSPPWRTSGPAARGRSTGSPSWSTSAAGPSSPTCGTRWTPSRPAGIRPRVLFLEASDDALVRRYEAVRRPHPLQQHDRLITGIRAERDAARRVPRQGRRRPRHHQPQRAPAAGRDRRDLRRPGPGAAAGDRGLVRLQVRPAAGRRHGARRAVPAQPALGRGAATAQRPGRRRPGLRAGPARRRGVPRPRRGAAADRRARATSARASAT